MTLLPFFRPGLRNARKAAAYVEFLIPDCSDIRLRDDFVGPLKEVGGFLLKGCEYRIWKEFSVTDECKTTDDE